LRLGRQRKALADLNLMFRNGKVGKTYWAVVEGGPEAFSSEVGTGSREENASKQIPRVEQGRIDLPLGRLDDKIGWWMKPDPEGLPSTTTWTVMGRGESAEGPLTWLALEPLTGRTHQLRVHCSASG